MENIDCIILLIIIVLALFTTFILNRFTRYTSFIDFVLIAIFYFLLYSLCNNPSSINYYICTVVIGIIIIDKFLVTIGILISRCFQMSKIALKVKLQLVKYKNIILELLLAIVFLILYFLQDIFELPHIKFSENGMIEILGISVAVLTLYGIYIAFLQFLTENNKVFYLGISKIRFLVDKSIYVQLTKRKLFYAMLLGIVIFPIFVKISNVKSNIINHNVIISIEYLWQACYFILLLLYVLLLKFTFKSVFSLLNYNVNNQNSNYNSSVNADERRSLIYIEYKYLIDRKIAEKIQKEFTIDFWEYYSKGSGYNFLSSKLTKYISEVESKEINELVYIIFYRDNWDSEDNLTVSIYKHLNSVKDHTELKKIYTFYKDYCKKKWEILVLNKKDISYKLWLELVKQDMDIFYELVNKDNTLINEGPPKDIRMIENKNIVYYLNKVLLEQVVESGFKEKHKFKIENVLNEYKHSIYQHSRFSKNEVTKKYIGKSFSYRLEQLLEIYLNGNDNIILPEFRSGGSDSCEEFYSKICFGYLQNTQLDNLLQNKRIKKIIFSMNDEYKLGFMLYQVLYPDGNQFSRDIEFYDKGIIDIISKHRENVDHIFKNASNIIANSDIGYRITKDILNNLWEEKSSDIDDFSWFDKYDSTRMSDFKVVYIQNLLNNLPEKYRSRFNFTNKSNGKDNIYFCKEYFKLIAKYPSLVSLKKYGNTIQTSVAYLLVNDIDDLSEIVTESPVRTLLHLEKILKNFYFIPRDYMIKSALYYNNKMFLRHKTMKEEDLLCYSGICEFYLLKVSDESYRQVYTPNFNNALKNSIINTLRNKDLTLLEYLDSIINELPEDLKVSKYEKDRIFLIINEWVSKIEVENFNSSYKKFNHKRKIRMTKV